MNPPSSPFTVPFDGGFRVADHRTTPPADTDGKKAALAERVAEIGDLQRKLYADDRFALPLVFQAMDAAALVREGRRGACPVRRARRGTGRGGFVMRWPESCDVAARC